MPMKQEKIVPYGVFTAAVATPSAVTLEAKALVRIFVMAGGH